MVRSETKGEMGAARVNGRVVEDGCHLPSHLFIRHVMRGERDAIESGQHTGIFDKVVCRFSRAVEFVIELGAFGEISVALA